VKSHRIPLSGSQVALQSPFATLDFVGLPSPPPIERVAAAAAKRGRVVLRREKAQRGGKTVVVASDFASHFSEADISALARDARRDCGCGGTVTGREIELQGDQLNRVAAFFEAQGFRVAGAGQRPPNSTAEPRGNATT